MTGLIYVIIIALWAAVLIPIWLRRHDQISEVRSTARFQSAMSTLGKRGKTQADAAALASRRRAITLGILLMALATTLVLGILNMAPMWLAILFAGLVGAYLVAAALTADQRGVAVRSERIIVETYVEDDMKSDEIVAESLVEAPARKRKFASLAQDEEFTKWDAWEEDNAWEAIPQTLPTYVGAPRASAVPRRIDREHDGAWTGTDMVRLAQNSRRLVTEDVIVDHSAHTAEIPIVQSRRAVNE